MSGILEQVHNALEWARANGIVNRSVAPDDIVLQQGSGRVLVAFGRDPEATELPNACDDVRTVGQLAWAMLAGGPPSAAPTRPLAERRPDLPPRIISETEALITCDRDGEPPDVSAFLASLGGIAPRPSGEAEVPSAVVTEEHEGDVSDDVSDDVTDESPVSADLSTGASTEEAIEVEPPVASADAVSNDDRPLSGEIRTLTPVKTLPTVIETPDRAATAVGADTDAQVVIRRRGMSFGARFMTAVAIAAVIVFAVLFFMRRRTDEAPRTVANTADTSALAAGDVALRAQQHRADTSSQAPVSVTIVPQPGAQTAPAGSATPTNPTTNPNQPVNPAAQNPGATPPLAPPTARRSEPPVSTNRPTVVPRGRPDSTSSALPNDSARVRSSAEVCASASGADQRTCLGQLINENDAELNSVYRRLLTAMRRKANIADQDPEPQSILDLKESERKWLEARDVACRDVGSGPRYARARASCFADQSAKRVRELHQMLDALPPA